MCSPSENLEAIHCDYVILALALEYIVPKYPQLILVLACCIVLQHYVRLQPIHHSPQGRMSLDKISTCPKP